MRFTPSHVAILVPSVRKAADFLKSYGFQIGDFESFEETNEIYVQIEERNSLLLMEPSGPGSYKRALEKRGPGLHHLAVDVLDLEKELGAISDSGWLLHLKSIKSIKSLKTAYLARPGFPGLIEVQEKPRLLPGPDFVQEIGLQIERSHQGLIEAVGLSNLVTPTTQPAFLRLQDHKIPLAQLF